MMLYGSPSVAEPVSTYVGSVWVVARHLLVAQAVGAALTRRVADVRPIPWAPRALQEAAIDPAEDVVLVVDNVSTSAGIAALQGLLVDAPARTLVLSGAEKGHLWGALLEAGATEIVPEPESVEGLASVLEQVRAGIPIIPVAERAALLGAWHRHLAEEDELVERMTTLSPREQTVLDCLASGRRSAEIGKVLGISESTVRTHVRSIRRKLGVDSQLRAVLAVHRLQSRAQRSSVAMPSPRRPRE